MPAIGYRWKWESGSVVTVDFSSKLLTAKCAELADEKLFMTATPDGDYVTWAAGK
jgi:hypothetical protein